jgi:hypothetical protein
MEIEDKTNKNITLLISHKLYNVFTSLKTENKITTVNKMKGNLNLNYLY